MRRIRWSSVAVWFCVPVLFWGFVILMVLEFRK